MSKPLRGAIAIDTWKLPIFERHLSAAGYTFEQANGPVDDTLILWVETKDFAALGDVVRAAQGEARRMKLH